MLQTFEASRAMADANLELLRNPRIGRILPRLFKEAGLTDIVVEATAVSPPDREENHIKPGLGTEAKRQKGCWIFCDC